VSVARTRLSPPHCLATGVCAGLASANVVRATSAAVLLFGTVVLVGASEVAGPDRRLVLAVAAVFLYGLWWGSLRLAAIDRSPLRAEVGRAEQALVEVTAPPRHGRFDIRAPARMLRFGEQEIREPIQLELPHGRAPPQGAILRVLGEIELPRRPRSGFDEATYLHRKGIHVVLKGDRWTVVGRRGGLGGVADRLRAGLGRALASGASGERKCLLLAIVLGDDSDLPDDLKESFRSAGLYHLLAVSGQNVALLAGGVLAVSWALGVARVFAEIGALAAIAAYVLAVGAQPSVVRAGVAGALASLAWLTARERDRWYFLLAGAIVLLAWNPYDVLDAGFQLSFAAVAAIFVFARPLMRRLEGYPLPAPARGTIAVSLACGLTTAPILCLHFGWVPLYTLVANVLAEPAMPPLLGLAFAAAALHPFAPGAAAAASALGGCCAAYVAWCARVVGGLPLARVPAPWVLAVLGAATAAYAWRRWRAT
jgi:competence protein ComEC